MRPDAPPLPPPFHAFTTKSIGGLLNSVITDVVVGLPYDPKARAQPEGYHCPARALWDTGASQSSISASIVERVGLTATGQGEVHHAGGSHTVATYLVSVLLPSNVAFPQVRVSEFRPGPTFDVLIGMDIITVGDFSITNVGGVSVVSFRTPSIATVDYVVEADRIRSMSKPDAKIGRNEKCPCGSGRKFKNCHGRE